jgi:hypothetical protein
MIVDARKRGMIVPLLFAPAEGTREIVACGDLLSVEAGRANRCTFENVRYLSAPIRKTKIRKRDGTKINPDFIRDYAICRTPDLNFADNRQVAISDLRQSRSAAGEIVRRLLPKDRLTDVLKAVARSVRAAHQASPSKWGLRLNRNSIMLKVGFVEVLQLGDGWFHQLVKRGLVSQKLRADRRLRFNDPGYVNAPGCDACDMGVPMVARTYSALLPAHEAAIRVAAQSRIHTSTTRDHSPGLIFFISWHLDALLPQPEYIEPHLAPRLVEERLAEEEFEEGEATQVLATRYERNSAARARCIQHYGTKCMACGVSLADRYGAEVSGLIHVHHLTPLASIRTRSTFNPIRELRPVCPNCHAVIHSTNPPRTIEQVRKMVRKEGL